MSYVVEISSLVPENPRGMQVGSRIPEVSRSSFGNIHTRDKFRRWKELCDITYKRAISPGRTLARVLRPRASTRLDHKEEL